MREALHRMSEAVQADIKQKETSKMRHARKSWCKHVANILDGSKAIVKAIEAGEHVLVHCSDGWDRTAQLTSLAELCLDPYYRTMEGFAILIEKEWISFGHQFTLRNGLLYQMNKCHVKTISNSHKSWSKSSSEKQITTDSTSDTATAIDATADEPKDQSGIIGNLSNSTGIDFSQRSAAFSKFASRTFKTVQNHLSSAIQSVGSNRC